MLNSSIQLAVSILILLGGRMQRESALTTYIRHSFQSSSCSEAGCNSAVPAVRCLPVSVSILILLGGRMQHAYVGRSTPIP